MASAGDGDACYVLARPIPPHPMQNLPRAAGIPLLGPKTPWDAEHPREAPGHPTLRGLRRVPDIDATRHIKEGGI